MIFELDTIKKVAEYCRKKPSAYHHRCTGNSDFRHTAAQTLDTWTPAKIIGCWRKGRVSHMTPRCEKCDGQHTGGRLLLTDGQKSFNRGIDRLIAVLEDVE